MQTQVQRESDFRLRAAVELSIERETEVMSRDIAVVASDGVVTLTGFVHHFYEKRAAGRAAESVPGVKAVANDVAVTTVGVRTDPEIVRDIVHSMSEDIGIPDNRITVLVRDGYVTLEGSLDWSYQMERAFACASRAFGVRGVDNRMQLKHPDQTPPEDSGEHDDFAQEGSSR